MKQALTLLVVTATCAAIRNGIHPQPAGGRPGLVDSVFIVPPTCDLLESSFLISYGFGYIVDRDMMSSSYVHEKDSYTVEQKICYQKRNTVFTAAQF